ncbi:MAG: FolC bifunctional protein [Desulfotomaculum sp. 46_296]|nr:MAG: FolC bifunctional protein [Desulfotomaculum sp. 46_296]HAU31943.1 bifunctional folylpolyglutamate synthase/dihydrofolate synthase [Desulfotomaculum sp.]
MDCNQAVGYLQNLTRFGINLGLDRITELLRRLGDPHLALNVVHIGGTNGKGSTLAMVSSILKAAGYRAGAFSSPHLSSYTERYTINGEEIAPERLAGLLEVIRPHLEDMIGDGFESPTEFEVCTALAFQYFYEESVDFLVLEVGLGGKIDSTNVVVPLVSVITNVSLDHLDRLGSTAKEIAEVKAGIIKSGVPTVTAQEEGEALEVIRAECLRKGSPLVVAREESGESLSKSGVFWSGNGKDTLEGQRFSIRGLRHNYNSLNLPLLGRHQLANAAAAVAVVELLAQEGYAINKEAVFNGLAAAKWPARFEVFRGDPPVVLDGAHNHAGAVSLRRALDDYFTGRKIILVIGILQDKQRSLVIGELASGASAVVVTRPDSPRAGDWLHVAEEAGRYAGRVYTIESVQEAVLKSLDLAGPGEIICITGSLYMVAEAREVLINLKGRV